VIFVEKGEIFQSFKAGDRLFIASAIGREQGQIVQGPDRVAIVPTKEASTVGQGLAEERFGLVEPTLVPVDRRQVALRAEGLAVIRTEARNGQSVQMIR
jgi:hypothetical protein